MTNYTAEFKTRIIEDYADQTKTCWASDSGKPVSECWCAQCNEARTLRPLFVEINTLKSETERLAKAFTDVRDFIQASINRDEWTETELEEIFWEELALMLGVDLKLTEEIDIMVTVTYTGTVTVPKGTDLDDIEFDTAWQLTGEHLGETVAELTYADIVVDRD